MLKKLKFAAVALLLPMIAFAQSYPSPTFQNLTVNGTFTSTGNIGLSSLAAQAANTILANATGSSASPTAIPMAGCNGAAQALQYTNGGGASAFTCNSNIATNGANANITSLSGLTTPLSVAQGGTGAGTQSTALSNLLGSSSIPVANGGTGRATLTANNVLLGNGTGTVSFAPPVSAGYVLTDNGPGNAPTFQAGNSGRLIGIQIFASSGTYTPTTGTNSIVVTCIGGGGGGGGPPATSASQVGIGTGGASGSFAKSRILSAFSGATVTIGAAGTGGAGANGGAGGTTSFGAFITAPGGGGGPGAVASNTASASVFGAAPGSSATGGNILNSAGTPSYGAFNVNGMSLNGPGASSPFGGGGSPMFQATGGAATGYGAGGGGAISGPSQAAFTGGAGSKGMCEVDEYN